MTDDELLLDVLLVERRFELGQEESSVDTHDEGKVGVAPGRRVVLLDNCDEERFYVMHHI